MAEGRGRGAEGITHRKNNVIKMEATFINLLTSWALFGLIWVIQLVHYPAFEFVDSQNFLAFHQHHTSAITFIVMPLMLIELGLSIYLGQHYQWNTVYLIPLLLVLIIWLSTFFIQVPLHNTLGNGKDSDLIQKLVNTNWIRTILWTIKAIWVSYYFYKMMLKK